ncbi:MAG: pilus assembly protein PilW, partial [Methylovulum sp.]
KDVRMAGFLGCSSFGAINVIVQPGGANPNPTPSTLAPTVRAVGGNNNVANNWDVNACGANECIAGTDAITFFSGGSCGGQLAGNMGVANANIQINVPNTCNINAYDVLIISDCSSTDIFIAVSASSAGVIQTIAHSSAQNTTAFLSKAYGPNAEIFRFNSSTYFIRAGAGGQPALWRLDNAVATGGTNPVELVEGIEDMQVLYGEDTDAIRDGTANYYVAAGTAGLNMDQVVSVRISLLVRTIDDNLADAPLAYTYNGVTTTPGDRRLRRVFTSTIAVRNRLP